MIGRTGFVGDLLYSVGVSGFIYPIIGHWAWGPDGFLATMGSAGNFLPSLGHGLPRFRRLHGGPHHRRLHRSGGRHRSRPAPRPQIQARRRRPHAAARSDHRRQRRPDPLVRLVRLQSRQHALGDGLRRHRPRRRQHHARRLRGRPDRHVLRLLHQQEVGRQASRSTDSWPAWSPSPAPATGSARPARSCSAASPA